MFSTMQKSMGMTFWSTEVGNANIPIIQSPHLSKSCRGCVHLGRPKHGIYGIRINKYVSHSRPGGSEKYLNVHTNGSNVLVSVHYLVLWPMMISYLVPVGLPGTWYSYSVQIPVYALVYPVLNIPNPYGYRYTGRIGQHPRRCFC